MENLHLKYKSDTGESAFKTYECVDMLKPLDADILKEFTKKEIIDMIEFDNKNNKESVISADKLDYNEWDEVIIYSPGYVKWLEKQLSNDTTTN